MLALLQNVGPITQQRVAFARSATRYIYARLLVLSKLVSMVDCCYSFVLACLLHAWPHAPSNATSKTVDVSYAIGCI